MRQHECDRGAAGCILLQHQGGLPERPMGADCKSVGLRLRRFESFTRHALRTPRSRHFRRAWAFGLPGRVVLAALAVAQQALVLLLAVQVRRGLKRIQDQTKTTSANMSASTTHMKTRKSIQAPIGGAPGMLSRKGTTAKSRAANQPAIVASVRRTRRLTATAMTRASTATAIKATSSSATMDRVDPARRRFMLAKATAEVGSSVAGTGASIAAEPPSLPTCQPAMSPQTPSSTGYQTRPAASAPAPAGRRRWRSDPAGSWRRRRPEPHCGLRGERQRRRALAKLTTLDPEPLNSSRSIFSFSRVSSPMRALGTSTVTSATTVLSAGVSLLGRR